MDDTLVERIEVDGGYVIEIHRDTDASDPREDCNVGTMVCEHRRYKLGDPDGRAEAKRAVYASRHYSPSWDEGWDAQYDFDDPPQLWAAVQRCSDIISMPLYLYDHGGITMSTSKFSCPWDSGQIGFIFCTNKKALEEWGHKGLPPQQRMSPKVRQKALDYMKGEVEAYDQYLTGDVYGYILNDDGGDSCWGLYGLEYAKEAAMEVVNEAKVRDQRSSAVQGQEAPAT